MPAIAPLHEKDLIMPMPMLALAPLLSHLVDDTRRTPRYTQVDIVSVTLLWHLQQK